MNSDLTTTELDMSSEERVRLSEFFNLLLKIDQRTHPELYLPTNSNEDD